jgi:sulfate adenylyltransferase subunit 2
MRNIIEKSLFILREAKAQFKKPAVLWSTGKDSTVMLALIKEAFFGKAPFPVVHLDTGYKFPEIYEFREKIVKEWDLNLIVSKRDNTNFHPDKTGHFKCCMELKTNALKDVLKNEKYDALIMSIRRDEHYMRNLERYYSPRDEELKWHLVRPKTKEEIKKGDAPFVSEQQVEFSGWDLFQSNFGPNCNHVRVHPILHWTELDVWNYIKEKSIPINPLYYSKNGKRFRSLGCVPCTVPIESNAKTIDEIIDELKTTEIEERAGRSQDKEREQVMRRLRSLGYM